MSFGAELSSTIGAVDLTDLDMRVRGVPYDEFARLRRLVAGLAQQPAQVDHHLLVDVLALGMSEERALRPDPDGHLAIVMDVDRTDRVQQRGHQVPREVVAAGGRED